MICVCLICVDFVFSVAPPMNLKIRGVTDRSIDLEWEGSVLLTDFLLTYTPSSASGKYTAVLGLSRDTTSVGP